jgi:methionyl-tRNA formyltransferase
VTLRLAFLGNDAWSVPSLETIAPDPALEVTLVVTNPPKPAGRGSALTPTPVAEAARAMGLPLQEVPGVREDPGLAALRGAGPDVLVVVAYGQILSAEVLGIGAGGAMNLHFSLLPRWRGAAPVQHALLAGETTTGVTVLRMDEGVDTGPVLARREEPIGDQDDAGSLGGRLATIGAAVLVEVLREIAAAPARDRGTVQDDRLATFAPRPGADDRRLDWTGPAGAVVRRVRAFAPDPATTTTFRDEPLKVLRAEVATEGSPDPTAGPGTILAADGRGVTVAAGEGSVRLVEVAPAGRKRMSAVDWGRGARFRRHERLT